MLTDDGRSISRSVTSLKIIVNDLINLLYYNNDNKTGNVLDYLYHQRYYKVIDINFIKTNKCEYSSTN